MSAGFRSRWLDWTPDGLNVRSEPEEGEPTRPTRGPSVELVASPLPKEDAARASAPADVVCFSCWGSDFWQGSGAVICRRCHPPAPGAEVDVSDERGARS